MLISVIIPHLNQPEHLERCLASLHGQNRSSGALEVIVVDNGSVELPSSICARWPSVKLLSESQPGPGPARNRGIADANGAILAFIDADCRADAGWLSAIETAFQDPSTKVIGGDVQVPFVDPAHPTALECYERIYAYRNKEYIASGFSGTGNLAMRPEAFSAVGEFAGVELAEDRDWGQRARASGIEIRYVPDMIVFHPARESFSELRDKWNRHILHDFSRVRGIAGRIRWLLRAIAIALSPLAEIFRILRTDRIRGWRQRLRAFLCLVRIRSYRAMRMVVVLFNPENRSAEKGWNRNSAS